MRRASCASSACRPRSTRSACARRKRSSSPRIGQLIFREPAGHGRRLRLAAVLDPSRRPAARAARRRARTRWAPTACICGHRCLGVDAGRRRACTRTSSTPDGSDAAERARPRRRRLRRHPFGAAQAALSGRGRAALFGRQHVARRRRSCKPFLSRREHGARGLARRRQDGDLSDPQRHRRRRATSSSTGSPRSRRRSPPAATGAGRASSKTSCLPSRTGTSTGWTCRR